MESPHGDPTTPGVAPAPACACPTAWADEVHRAGQICRKTGRQGGQPDTPSRTGRARASPDLTSHARLPCPTLPTQPHFSPCPPTLPADLSRLPTLPACPPYPISCRARMCHIVNRSATRATRKTAFCQALLPFSDLSKRYTLIHSNLHVY